jgi:hypothetical protein
MIWRMTGRRSVAVVAIVLSLAACSRRDAGKSMIVRTVETPTSPGSGEANLAVAPDGRVLLSWVEPLEDKGHRLRLASRATGSGWSPPLTIAEGSGWFVNWADFPAVVALPDGTLFAHWLAKSGTSPYAYDVRITSSRDGGRTWSPPVIPHRDGTQAEHGFVSMVPSRTGEVGIVWLDGRKTADIAHAGHEATPEAMSLMHTTLDADGRLGAETVLDDRVCDCCQTDAVTAAGTTFVVYRDRSEKELRDMSIVRFAGGRWSPPQPLAPDGWEINGCPVNGPAIAAAASNVAVAWFTAARGEPRVKVAFSRDAGASFDPAIVVDDGRPLGRVDVASLDDGAAIVTWLEKTDKGAAMRVRRVARDGSASHALTVADSDAARSSGFPRIVRSGNEVTIAWRDSAEPPRVRTAAIAIDAID